MSDYKDKLSLWERIDLFFSRIRIKHSNKKWDKKYRKQRYKRGYADEDLFSLDYWFSTTFVNMIEDFEKNVHGYPSANEFPELSKLDISWKQMNYNIIIEEMLNDRIEYNTKEELMEEYPITNDFIQWKLILKRIAYCLKESNEEYCSYKNKYSEDWINNWKDEPDIELADKYFKECDKIYNYQCKMVKEAFSLISKYYFALWD